LEAIHRFCNRLQGRRYVAGTWLQPAFVIVSSRGEREAPSDLTLIRSMDPARPPDTKQTRSITRIPIVRMYIYRVLPFNRSSKTKQERKKEREERKTKRSHGNQVRELIPLYLTVNISLRLDVSPYNARCFLLITVPLIMQRRTRSPSNNDGQISNRSPSLLQDRMELFFKRKYAITFRAEQFDNIFLDFT